MTKVAFHFNVPDKMHYICRLLRKAAQAQARVVVFGPQQELNTLDEALWAFSPQSFVTHCWSHDGLHTASLSSVVLNPIENTNAEHVMPHHQVLLNVGHTMPEGYETFERVIEVVGLSENDKSQARQRWKQYAQRGYILLKHDLSSKLAAV
jgi:DNA polymerase III subunit chi